MAPCRPAEPSIPTTGGCHHTVDGEALWREDRIDALLADAEATADERVLVVSGTTRNQGAFRARLDAIVLLSAAIETLAERLRTRTTNPCGRDPAETLGYARTVEPLLRRTATLEAITTVSLERVADLVLAHVPA